MMPLAPLALIILLILTGALTLDGIGAAILWALGVFG